LREYVVENEFVKAVKAAGGVAYKLTSQTANGLPDRLVLFFPAKTVFVELKAPGKMMRPLQRKRRYQLMKLGFPVLCIDKLYQIKPCIDAILSWTPGTPFPGVSERGYPIWRSQRYRRNMRIWTTTEKRLSLSIRTSLQDSMR
jgi:hypothetical protein